MVLPARLYTWAAAIALMRNYELRYIASRICHDQVLYSGKLSREKTFTNFAVLEPSAKVFSTKFGHAVPTYDRFQHSAKVFSMK